MLALFVELPKVDARSVGLAIAGFERALQLLLGAVVIVRLYGEHGYSHGHFGVLRELLAQHLELLAGFRQTLVRHEEARVVEPRVLRIGVLSEILTQEFDSFVV